MKSGLPGSHPAGSSSAPEPCRDTSAARSLLVQEGLAQHWVISGHHSSADTRFSWDGNLEALKKYQQPLVMAVSFNESPIINGQ